MNQKTRGIIKLEISDAFPKIDVNELIDLYENIICLETDVESGVKNEWINNIELFYDFSDSTIRTVHKQLINSESVFKKLLYLLDPTAYSEICKTPGMGLFKTIDKLGLLSAFSHHINFTNAKASDFDDPIQKSIILTYQLRNNTSHSSESWAPSEMTVNVKAVLIATCYAVWKNRQQFSTLVQRDTNTRKYDIASIMKTIVSNYEKRQRSGFKYVQLKWVVEGKDTNKSSEHLIDVKELLPNKQLMLLGDAGCGKTTAIEWLELHDAKAYLQNDSRKIPVKIQLINENSFMTIIECICKELNVPRNYAEKLLKSGDLHVYIDGINELPGGVESRKNFIRELDSFITEYPDVFLVVTDRKFTQFKPRINCAYTLKALGKNEVLTYAKSRPEFSKNIEAQLNEMFTKPGYEDFVYTPLLVNQIVDVIASGNQIPEDPSGFIGLYIESLFKREYEEKQEIMAGPGKLDLLLMRLSLVEGISDDGISISKLFKSFTETINAYGLSLNSDSCYELARQLNIITNNNNRIMFSSQEIYGYFFSKAIEEDIEL